MPKNIDFKILTIVGARPQFIKSATISRILNSKKYNGVEEVIVHTGQHYDDYMSGVFFRELEIPAPNYNLHVGSGSHSQQTGLMLTELEKVVEIENPNVILVYGDTNSTLAGALVAAKKPCKLAHVEAGLRSFRKGMAEEVNRVVTDSLSDVLFCPTTLAKNNLEAEGKAEKSFLVGDVMYDSYLYYSNKVNSLKEFHGIDLIKNKFILATIHRAENTDNLETLKIIFSSFKLISKNIRIILPLHPRTKKMVEKLGLSIDGIDIIDPVPYKTMISLLGKTSMVITDSGGLQKEAYFAKVPCLTLRDETEWIETLDNGWNRLLSPNSKEGIVSSVMSLLEMNFSNTIYCENYGNGKAAEKIINGILRIE